MSQREKRTYDVTTQASITAKAVPFVKRTWFSSNNMVSKEEYAK
jgi:hypothetical protein